MRNCSCAQRALRLTVSLLLSVAPMTTVASRFPVCAPRVGSAQTRMAGNRFRALAT